MFASGRKKYLNADSGKPAGMVVYSAVSQGNSRIFRKLQEIHGDSRFHFGAHGTRIVGQKHSQLG